MLREPYVKDNCLKQGKGGCSLAVAPAFQVQTLTVTQSIKDSSLESLSMDVIITATAGFRRPGL